MIIVLKDLENNNQIYNKLNNQVLFKKKLQKLMIISYKKWKIWNRMNKILIYPGILHKHYADLVKIK